ncbi:hypothetical protein DFH27DRAFT_570551 [Peziza echinospora]|nr:hypothetical protein DFH27DRAFT_570551 [Peziza echinospora]
MRENARQHPLQRGVVGKPARGPVDAPRPRRDALRERAHKHGDAGCGVALDPHGWHVLVLVLVRATTTTAAVSASWDLGDGQRRVGGEPCGEVVWGELFPRERGRGFRVGEERGGDGLEPGPLEGVWRDEVLDVCEEGVGGRGGGGGVLLHDGRPDQVPLAVAVDVQVLLALAGRDLFFVLCLREEGFEGGACYAEFRAEEPQDRGLPDEGDGAAAHARLALLREVGDVDGEFA